MRVPVVSVTGHLGAGKTSLLNHLLRAPGARLGVVINDFGAINVDAALVTGQVDEAAAISGGCVCCLPDSGGLDDALEKLSDPRLRLDAIIIEASGAADPIALSRLVRFSGAERVRAGGIVEVIDAVNHFDTVDTRPDPPARYGAASRGSVSGSRRGTRARPSSSPEADGSTLRSYSTSRAGRTRSISSRSAP
jgi:G3E family GTPase